jgi:hypothetical protein
MELRISCFLTKNFVYLLRICLFATSQTMYWAHHIIIIFDSDKQFFCNEFDICFLYNRSGCTGEMNLF